MMLYQHRILEKKLTEYIQHFPAIGLTGPRQSGKSTLLKHTLPDYTYVTFDDYRAINLFQNDPQRFIASYPDKIIFDEVQKVPELFNYIKIAIDEDRNRKGKFILTGSSQFTLIKNASESLAGRIGLLSLLPFQYAEIPKKLHQESVYKGGYPELIDTHYKIYSEWFASYIETYLHKDIATLGHVGDIRDFRRLIQLLAANTSQQLNLTRYANDIGVDVKTIKRWISILEASYILFLVPPYYKNYGKRLVKSPKIYFYDVGLVSFLTGIESKELFEKGPMAGSIFENYIVAEILKNELHHKTHADLYYLRTSNGVEVDLVIDRKIRREFIEIKNSATFTSRMTAPMAEFIEKSDQAYLLYRGDDFAHPKPIQVLNYENYFLNMNPK